MEKNRNSERWYTYSICCAVLISLLSCNVQRQVWFSEIQKRELCYNKTVSKIFIDKNGDLYSAEDYIPEQEFYDPNHSGEGKKENGNNANLRSYYTIHKESFEKLKSTYGVHSSGEFENDFISLQQKITEGYAAAITDQLKKSTDKTLVVLVHGFNEDDPAKTLTTLREAVEQKNHGAGVYLEVYWDGLSSRGHAPFLKAIWARAQLNSAYAGMTLRRLIALLPADTKLRILTHSLGASVATVALFDSYHKFRQPPVDLIQENDAVSCENISDVRLGMLAPAIPGENTFRYFLLRGGDTIKKSENNIHRVIAGINTRDYAVTKGVGLSKVLGSTSLGGSEKEFQRTVKVLEKEVGYSAPEADQLLLKVDFNTQNTECKSEHSAKCYMNNQTAKDAFLNQLLN